MFKFNKEVGLQKIQILQKNIENSNIKLSKCQKLLKNQKIHYLEIIETKQNIYVTTQ